MRVFKQIHLFRGHWLNAAAALACLTLLLSSGCGGLIVDPTKRIETGRGHITDRQSGRTPTGSAAPAGGGIAIGDDGPSKPRPRRRAPRGVTLNFDGTDIREVVKVILGDLLGVNYVLDPAVSGSVSLETGRPLRRDLLIPTLEMLLRMNNAALVDNAAPTRSCR
jgi:general secretion pathway protein D